MKKLGFPWLALGIGLLLALVLERSGAMNPDAENALPLLTLLVMAEFGFILTLIGAAAGVRTQLREGFKITGIAVVLGCGLLAAGFLWLGIELWPGGFPAGMN